MRIYFLHHGETDSFIEGKLTGQWDVPLNENGKTQSQNAAQDLPKDIDAMYCSDLLRAKQTAEIIVGARCTVPLLIIYTPLLRERDFGDLTGKTWDEVNDIDSAIREKEDQCEFDYTPWGGESWQDVQRRIDAFFEMVGAGLKPAPTRRNILVVGHGGWIRLMRKMRSGEISAFGSMKNTAYVTIEI